jgi:hypothetical protein
MELSVVPGHTLISNSRCIWAWNVFSCCHLCQEISLSLHPQDPPQRCQQDQEPNELVDDFLKLCMLLSQADCLSPGSFQLMLHH